MEYLTIMITISTIIIAVVICTILWIYFIDKEYKRMNDETRKQK